MILKSLILGSIIFNLFGLNGLVDKFDQAAIRQEVNPTNTVAASLNDLILPEIADRPKIVFGSTTPQIYAKRYLLTDLESGAILAKENYKQRVPIASTTKIMSAIIVLENYNLDDIVTLSNTAVNQLSEKIGLRTNEKITVRNLLKSMLIVSSNGSAYALAEHMNTNGENGTGLFVEKMNEKAKALGLADTDYHDPAGLDTTGYSSAYDLYLATKYAMENPVFADIVRTSETTIFDVSGKISHKLQNSNRLISEWNYPGAIGVKTGYMEEAGHTLVAAAKRDGHTLIAIILFTNADTPTASAEEARRLLDWGWTNVRWE